MITGECLRRPWSPQVFKHLRKEKLEMIFALLSIDRKIHVFFPWLKSMETIGL